MKFTINQLETFYWDVKRIIRNNGKSNTVSTSELELIVDKLETSRPDGHTQEDIDKIEEELGN